MIRGRLRSLPSKIQTPPNHRSVTPVMMLARNREVNDRVDLQRCAEPTPPREDSGARAAWYRFFALAGRPRRDADVHHALCFTFQHSTIPATG